MRELQLEDFVRLLDVHQPVQIRREHIELAEKETADEPILVDIPQNYPTVLTSPTGGYILPSEILPFRFKERLLYEGIGTPEMWSNKSWMISEVIINALTHGNKEDNNKVIYLLWHQCSLGKEVYVVDQSEVEFDLKKGRDKRRRLASGGKDYYSGTDLLGALEYFTIVDPTPKKKGTLVKIVLEPGKQNQEAGIAQSCSYLGHQLFSKPQP